MAARKGRQARGSEPPAGFQPVKIGQRDFFSAPGEGSAPSVLTTQRGEIKATPAESHDRSGGVSATAGGTVAVPAAAAVPDDPRVLQAIGRAFTDPRVESVGRVDAVLGPKDDAIWWVRMRPTPWRSAMTYFGPSVSAAMNKAVVREAEAADAIARGRRSP